MNKYYTRDVYEEVAVKLIAGYRRGEETRESVDYKLTACNIVDKSPVFKELDIIDEESEKTVEKLNKIGYICLAAIAIIICIFVMSFFSNISANKDSDNDGFTDSFEKEHDSVLDVNNPDYDVELKDLMD